MPPISLDDLRDRFSRPSPDKDPEPEAKGQHKRRWIRGGYVLCQDCRGTGDTTDPDDPGRSIDCSTCKGQAQIKESYAHGLGWVRPEGRTKTGPSEKRLKKLAPGQSGLEPKKGRPPFPGLTPAESASPVKCQDCAGAGSVDLSDAFADPGETSNAICGTCSGRGEISRHHAAKLGWEPEPLATCQDCAGVGRLRRTVHGQIRNPTCKTCSGPFIRSASRFRTRIFTSGLPTTSWRPGFAS